jgi:sporulation integral membrane protein YtvI
MDSDLKIRLLQVFRFIFVIFIILIGGYALHFSVPLIYPFLIGFIIAYVINKPVNLLVTKVRLPRWLSVLVVLLLSISVMIGIVTVLITQVVVEISHLITIMPIYINDATNYIKQTITQELITNFYNRFQLFYSSLDISYQSKIEETIGSALSSIAKGGTYLVNAILGGIQAFLLSLPNAATVLVISVLAAFFISNDYYRIKKKLSSLLPKLFHSKLEKVIADLKRALFGFVKAQLTLISITAFIVIIGLLILRVEYAFTIGIVTGVVDLLPLFGTSAVFIPWIIYLFIKQNYSLVIGLSILLVIIVVQRQIMEPKIVADNVGLDPLVTLISLFVGLQLFGVAGLILGPLSVVIFTALINAGVFEDLWGYIKGDQA